MEFEQQRAIGARLQREWAKVQVLTDEIWALTAVRRDLLRTGTDPAVHPHVCACGGPTRGTLRQLPIAFEASSQDTALLRK